MPETKQRQKQEPLPLSELTHKLVLTVQEAHRLTGYAERTICDAINHHELKAKRIGLRAFTILRSDLDEWLKELPEVPVERPAKVVRIRRTRR